MLEVAGLTAGVGSKEILKDLSLSVEPGALVVLMGPNGSGKSTLANVLAGKPGYSIMAGEIRLGGEELAYETPPEERVRKGLLVVFQQPPPLYGLRLSELLAAELEAVRGSARGEAELVLLLQRVGLEEEYLGRFVNAELSGGERKKIEMLQFMVISPKYLVVDELDSGLDVDSVRTAATLIGELRKSGCAVLVITHQARLVSDMEPDIVYVLVDGSIAAKGGKELMEAVRTEGYEALVGR